jgi:protein phosphatase
MCVHGGISPSISTLADLEAEVVRPLVSVSNSSVVDILWSDPSSRVLRFKPNTRGTGFFYGSEPLEEFLDDNGLDCLIRAHEWCDAGSDWPFGQQGRCLTVFSSSDYCGKGNKGAVTLVSEDCRIETVEFEPIVHNKVRRVLLPVWILAEGRPVMEPVLPEVPDVCIDANTEAEIGLLPGF